MTTLTINYYNVSTGEDEDYTINNVSKTYLKVSDYIDIITYHVEYKKGNRQLLSTFYSDQINEVKLDGKKVDIWEGKVCHEDF